jgi:hypothetical protein
MGWVGARGDDAVFSFHFKQMCLAFLKDITSAADPILNMHKELVCATVSCVEQRTLNTIFVL